MPLRPPRLRAAARIGVVSPSYWIEPERLDRAVGVFEAAGYELVIGPSVTARQHKFAGTPEERAAEWASFKQGVEARVMAFYEEKFPALAPLIVYRELGTPLATAAFTGHEKGAFYGVETTPRRLMSDALAARTPVPGLFLTGQDVMTPGIAGALAGGMLGAAAIDPKVYRKFV